jgi:GT2 family glycosyltransferase
MELNRESRARLPREHLSVVIVSYESWAPVAACLESLSACRERIPLEVVLVDNASTDGTVELVGRAHPWVEVIGNRENLGFTRGVNQGFARTSGDAVLILNPDCLVTADALERLLSALASDPRLAAVAPALLDVEGRITRSCGRFPDLWTLLCDHLRLIYMFPDSPLFGRYKYGGQPIEALDRVDWASGAAFLVARHAWQEIGGLDERIFMYMEEVDWFRRASRAGLSARYVPEARIVHYGQQSSRQAPVETYLHNLRSRVYYFRKHHGRLAALLAKGILGTSLVLKWLATLLRRRAPIEARMYAAGIGTVWTASWR